MHVSRLLASGEVIHDEGILHLETDAENRPGRSVMEYDRKRYFAKVGAARAFFLAAEDIPIPDFSEWFMISNHPAVMNRHTEGMTCMTKVVMDNCG